MKRPLSRETVHGVCVDLSFEGKGVVKDGKDIYFVPGIFPGEEGEIEFSYMRAGQKFGRVVKLTKISLTALNRGVRSVPPAEDVVFSNIPMRPNSVINARRSKSSSARSRRWMWNLCLV